MAHKIEWNRQFKIALREVTDAQTKHLVIKSLLVQRLVLKHAHHRYWIKVYTEHPICDGKVCDVYFENIKTKECYAYEIQKVISPKWLKETENIYKNWEVLNMRTGWVLIDVNDCPNDIDKLKEYIDRQIL